MIFAKLVFTGECYVRDVAPGAGLTGDTFAEIVHNDIVKSRFLLCLRRDCAVLCIDPVKYLNELKDANPNACFLEKLPSDALPQCFTKLQSATRNGPLTA